MFYSKWYLFCYYINIMQTYWDTYTQICKKSDANTTIHLMIIGQAHQHTHVQMRH